jgi:hypothetical protein
MINLLEYALELAKGTNSLYRGIRYDKARLVEFMEVNDWFGITPTVIDKAPHITAGDGAQIRERIILWLSAFKQPNNVKLNVLLNYFEQNYPQTCELYREFVGVSGAANAPGAWKLLDCIFYNIETEITECTETEIEDFIKLLDAEATLDAARLFTDFLRFAKLSKWGYEFYSRERPDVSNEAYPLRDYAVMAYCVWGEEMWERHSLIEKAAANPQFADMWLYTALHFVCALRSSDMRRLPAPKLPYEAEQVLSDISAGVFPDRLAVALTDELVFRLKMSGLKPHKTSKRSNVLELKLFVPESLRKPLGIIIAIVLAHNAESVPGGPFVSGTDYRRLHGQFFGADFRAAMGARHLSVRRCNKSYLQGIDAATDGDTPGKPKGYILAALARSHKGGIGKLPEITDVYLKDANFTGYKPEFIAAQMFERGVFSFIAAAMLEIYSGRDFTTLPIASQTALIITTGLVPAQIENLTAAAETSMSRATAVVSELICNRNYAKQELGAVLQNIASGNAPSRMDECLCLMSAVGEPCPNPDRASCIGCGYEILTKSAMQLLIREYSRLNRLRRESDGQGWRYSAMLDGAVIPAIGEIISCAKTLAPGADMTALLDIAERGLELHAAD